MPPLTLFRYFASQPLADLSFSQDCVEADYVLAGLRRLRSQTNAKAKAEGVHKPLHPEWCRLRCRPYKVVDFCFEWKDLVARLPSDQEALHRCVSRARAAWQDQGPVCAAETPGVSTLLHHCTSGKVTVCPLYLSLSVINLSIDLSNRCAIVRLLEWGTTLVKSEGRYVIDLKNNPGSAAAKHKVLCLRFVQEEKWCCAQ